MKNNFYITLPSNVGHTFKKNSIANYTTKLASRLELHGEWEVGLVEMSYTVSWYNFPEIQDIEVKYWKNGPKSFSKTIKFPKGRYDKIDDILRALNSLMLEIRGEIKHVEVPSFVVNSKNRKVSIKCGYDNSNRMIFPILSTELCTMLGIDRSKMIESFGTKLLEYDLQLNTIAEDQRPIYKPPKPSDDDRYFDGIFPYEIAAGYHSLFVYSDIVKPSFVGDSYTQLLRLVQIPTDCKFGEQVLITYPNTYYVPLMTHDFETIEIHIKDDTGESIPFEFGRSIVVLHFRRRL